MSTLLEARNAIMLQFRTAWLANITSAGVTLLYDDVEGDEPGHNANGEPTNFARITVRHFTGGAETIGGDSGKELEEGQVVVQVFTPKGHGYSSGDILAQIAKRAFQRKRITGIDGWYHSVVANEIATSGPWAQINVVARFRYGERVTI